MNGAKCLSKPRRCRPAELFGLSLALLRMSTATIPFVCIEPSFKVEYPFHCPWDERVRIGLRWLPVLVRQAEHYFVLCLVGVINMRNRSQVSALAKCVSREPDLNWSTGVFYDFQAIPVRTIISSKLIDSTVEPSLLDLADRFWILLL